MVRVGAPYEAPDNVLPGVVGGSAGVLGRYAYKYTKRLGSRFAKWYFKPKTPTYRGAVGRGIGGSAFYEFFDDDGGGIKEDAYETPVQVPGSSQQRNYRLVELVTNWIFDFIRSQSNLPTTDSPLV